MGYKINSNGCAKGNLSLSRGRGLLRDWQANVIFGYSCFFDSLTSLHAELKAMVFGVRQCFARGFYKLHIEVDSLILVKMLQGLLVCLGSYNGSWTNCSVINSIFL